MIMMMMMIMLNSVTFTTCHLPNYVNFTVTLNKGFIVILPYMHIYVKVGLLA